MPELEDTDPILKMAIIHFQFESIHPFYDGNGRTRRMLKILYLTLAKKIDLLGQIRIFAELSKDVKITEKRFNRIIQKI